jgi:CubicO group peptidase (beta-lactamase class C family)
MLRGLRSARSAAAFFTLAVALAVGLGAGSSAAPKPKPGALSQAVALDAATLMRIDRLLRTAVADGTIPGAQVIVLGPPHARTLLRSVYGARTFEPQPIPNDFSTVYELASLTKPVATASAIMLLVQRGELRLRDRIATYIPEFAQNGKETVTVEQVLLHTSGLPPAFSEDDYYAERPAILEHTYARKLLFAPGTGFSYSNLGPIVLTELIARITHEPFERFVATELFAPLGMRDSFFDTTLDAPHRALLAPQVEREDTAALRKAFGTVPGVNGHAGMLSTADDLARYARALLLTLEGRRPVNAPLEAASLRAMIEPHYVGRGGLRGLGWDLDSSFSGNRGDLLPRGGFGHTGSSGTSLWIDPALGIAVIFTSNAHYPKDAGDTLPLEAKLANLVAAAVLHDRVRVAAQEAAFDAAAARSALGFPATPLPAPSVSPSPLSTRALPG